MVLPEAYEALSFEDRIASMMLAAIYTTEHIDLTIRMGPAPPVQKRAKDQQLAQENRIAELKARVAGPTLEYFKTYPDAMVIYRSQNIAPDQTPKTVSEIGFDTVAVVIAGKVLYVASNYKVRMINPSPSVMNEEVTYVAYGAPGTGGQASAIQMLTDELSLTPSELAKPNAASLASITRINFLGPSQPPANVFDAAAPHAEMQLVHHLTESGITLSGLRFGVSKACCVLCSALLTKAKITFTDRPGANEKPKNWADPSRIQTKVAASYDCFLKGS